MSSDNITLVRAAKPAKKDLPAGKDVKGGKKKAQRRKSTITTAAVVVPGSSGYRDELRG